MAEIRLMETKDLPVVAEVEQKCFTVPWSMTLLSECLGSPLDKVWVLEEGGKIEGYCNFRVIAGEGELMRIAVLPASRGRGYGRELMEILAEYARANRVEEISLEVRASNSAAINLYKSYGFKIEAVRKRYYSSPVEDALIMWRRGVEIITTKNHE